MQTNTETYYTVGTREQAAFECDGTEDWDEAVEMLKAACAEWEADGGEPEAEPIITEFRGDEAVSTYTRVEV